MEIKVKVDEAKIIKQVMDGLSTEEIQNNIVKDIKEKIKERIINKIRWEQTTAAILEKDFNSEIRKRFMVEIKEKLKEEFSPKRIKKLIKSDDIDECLGVLLSDYVENALSEWLSLDFNVSINGKKKTTVTVCGKDSYTYRKR